MPALAAVHRLAPQATTRPSTSATAQRVLTPPSTNEPQTPASPAFNNEDPHEMEHDAAAGTDQGGPWIPAWTRRKPAKQSVITRLDRVSRPRELLLLRPLSKTSIRDIPKNALAALIGGTAPTLELAELSTHRYDLAGNSIQITLYDKEHAARLLSANCVQFQHAGRQVTVPIELKPLPNRTNTSRGVITVESNDTNEDILQWIRCEQADVLAVQRIGKTNRAVLTFDSPTPPRVVKYYMAIVKVAPYQPKRMVCFSCHTVGHMSKYCPRKPVCKKCGRTHDETLPCERTLFCAACKRDGHLAVDPKCPSRTATPPRTTSRIQEGITWADRVVGRTSPRTDEAAPLSCPAMEGSTPSNTNGLVNQDILRQLDDLRTELKQLREENRQLKVELAAARQGTPAVPIATADPPKKSALRDRSATTASSRRSRSISRKRTPTSQPPSEAQEFMQVLKFIRADLQQERRERLADMEKLRVLTDQYATQTSAMIGYITKYLPGITAEEDKQPPRKVTVRDTTAE